VTRLLPPEVLSRSKVTDIHQSNIFVDDEGHIISLIDLEWPSVLALWMMDDMGHGEPLESFNQVITELFDSFEQEEKLTVVALRQKRFTQIIQSIAKKFQGK
jgi:hypothetical protein